MTPNTVTIPIEFFEQLKKDRDIWQEKYYTQKHNAERLSDELQSKSDSDKTAKLVFEKHWLIECLQGLAELAGCGTYPDGDISDSVRKMIKEVQERYPNV